MKIEEILKNAIQADASDIFLIAGLPLTYKCSGNQNRVGEKPLYPEIRHRCSDPESMNNRRRWDRRR